MVILPALGSPSWHKIEGSAGYNYQNYFSIITSYSNLHFQVYPMFDKNRFGRYTNIFSQWNHKIETTLEYGRYLFETNTLWLVIDEMNAYICTDHHCNNNIARELMSIHKLKNMPLNIKKYFTKMLNSNKKEFIYRVFHK